MVAIVALAATSSAIGSNHRSTPPNELVVLLTLIMRLMRLALDAAARVDRKHRIPPPPIPAATGEVRIDFEVIPAGGERPANQAAARTTPAPRASRPAHERRTPTPGAIVVSESCGHPVQL
jgi:hypothetical protein